MKYENGYKVIYDAPQRVTESAPNRLYATKTIPAATDTMITAYDNGTTTALDLRTFKLIYSDGTHLLGSATGIPSTSDTNIVLKCGNEIVFGAVLDTETEEPLVTAAPKRSTRKAAPAKEPEVEAENN